MEYMKMDNYKDSISSTDKFVINNLVPVGFREIEKNKFVFLFLAVQDFDEKTIYLQLFFSASNQFEYDTLKKHPNYIQNYKNNKDSLEMYKKMIEKLSKDTLYITDFFLIQNKDFPLYYNTSAVKAISNTQVEKLNLYLPRNTFVKVKCLLGNYNVRSTLFPTSIMNRLNINDIRFAIVERVVNNGSVMLEDDYIDTHYNIKAENKFYKINYRTKKKKYYFPINLLDKEAYSKYENDYYLEYIFKFDDKVYVIYPEENNNKVILVFDQEKTDQTNFIDQFNTIFKEAEKRNEDSKNQ